MAHTTALIDEAVLGLLYLNMHGATPDLRAWKGFDWDSLDRLHGRGLISDPRTKARSVAVTPEGLAAAKAAYDRLFGAA